MINDIKGGGNGCESQKLIRTKKNKMEKIDFDCDCEFKCECESEGLVRDIPDTCKYCHFRMKMSMKGNEEEAAEELVEEEKEKGENCEEEDVAVELDVGKLDENVEGGEEEDDDEEGEMINDIKGGEMAVRVKN